MNAVLPASIAPLKLELSQTKDRLESLKKLLAVIAVVEVVAYAALALIAPYASLAVNLALSKYFLASVVAAYPTFVISAALAFECKLNIPLIQSNLKLEYLKHLHELLKKDLQISEQIRNFLTDKQLKQEPIIDLAKKAQDAARTVTRPQRRATPNQTPLIEAIPAAPEEESQKVIKKTIVAEIEGLFVELRRLRQSNIPLAELKQQTLDIQKQIKDKYNALASDETKKRWAREDLWTEINQLLDEKDLLWLQYDDEGPVTERIDIVQESLDLKEKLLAKYGHLADLEKSFLEECAKASEDLLQRAIELGKELRIPMDGALSPLPQTKP